MDHLILVFSIKVLISHRCALLCTYEVSIRCKGVVMWMLIFFAQTIAESIPWRTPDQVSPTTFLGFGVINGLGFIFPLGSDVIIRHPPLYDGIHGL